MGRYRHTPRIKYMMYEGEDVNTIDLLYETPTDQPNGVKVIVPIKYYDRYSFENKIREQLAYFESVYFDVDGISNDFVITRHDYFQFSELASNNYMHLCLDNVYYPIDFEKLGIDTLRLPIALRFSLTDGIFPTPNRESIRYTQEAKAVILKRLQDAANYFIEKYNETVKETTDLKRVIDYFGTDHRYLKMGKSNWDVHPLSKHATVKIAAPKLKGINLLDMQHLVKLQDYILGEYEGRFYVNGKTMRDTKRYYQVTSIKNLKHTVYVYYGDRIPGLKKDYIKSIQPDAYTDALIVRKVKDFPFRPRLGRSDYDNYYTILQLSKHPKSEWKQRIEEFKSIVKSYVDNFVNIDTMEVPQEFIDSRKKDRISTGQIKGTGVATGPRRVKLKGEMICKQAAELERWVDGKTCKWVSKTYDMAKFHQNKFILVYGKQEDAEAAKARAEAAAKAYKEGRDAIKKEIAAANKLLTDSTKTQTQIEIDDVKAKYAKLIEEAKKYKLDITALEKAQTLEINNIRKEDSENNEMLATKTARSIVSTMVDTRTKTLQIQGEGNMTSRQQQIEYNDAIIKAEEELAQAKLGAAKDPGWRAAAWAALVWRQGAW